MTTTARQLAQQRIASFMDPGELEAVARIKALNSCHIKSARDAEAQSLYRKLIRNTQTETAKQAGLVIMGNSGSGKTHIIRSMEKIPEFQRYRVPGEQLEMFPYLSVDAPPKSAPNFLLATIVRACGFPVSQPGNVGEMLELVWDWFETRRVLFLHIDEFQHALRSNTEKQIKEIQDTIKALIQITARWPVQIILSGTPSIKNFRESNHELSERTFPWELDGLSPVRDAAAIEKLVAGIITNHAGLRQTVLDDEDFVAKLAKSANYQFGSIIQVVRLACEEVILANTSEVGLEHFASVYQMLIGKRDPDLNLFTSASWKDINLPKAIVSGKAFEKLKNKREKAREKTFKVRGTRVKNV